MTSDKCSGRENKSMKIKMGSKTVLLLELGAREYLLPHSPILPVATFHKFGANPKHVEHRPISYIRNSLLQNKVRFNTSKLS